jgi:hypothetical protein
MEQGIGVIQGSGIVLATPAFSSGFSSGFEIT